MDTKLDQIDAGREVVWGAASADYAAHRPDPPQALFDALRPHGIGCAGQQLLDLGTGTGAAALAFARNGALVCGTDMDEGQIAAARQRAPELTFEIAPAQTQPFAAAQFDAITALQCWLYFPQPQTLAECARLLRPGGRLALLYFSFMPRRDPIVAASEALVLQHNPDWCSGDWSGQVPLEQLAGFRLTASLTRDARIPFTRKSWRGRMRALRGIGASLAPDAVAAFDADHAQLLQRIAPPDFTILHRFDAQIFQKS